VLLLLTYKSLSVAAVYLPYYPGARPYHIVERMLGETAEAAYMCGAEKGPTTMPLWDSRKPVGSFDAMPWQSHITPTGGLR